MSRVSVFGSVLIGLAGLATAGCSKGGGPINGSVTLDGQPVADARVEFRSNENRGAAIADVRTNQEGKFVIPPRPKGGGPGLPPGKYTVLVRKLVDREGKVPGEEDYGQLEAAGMLINKLPQRYSDEAFPQLTVDVAPDTKALPPLELKSR